MRLVPPKGASVRERLEFYGWDETESGCWEWRGSISGNGYGVVSDSGRSVSTHRAAYTLWVGPIPEGHVVRHKRDNKPCINPDHLETGTLKDNHADMWDRGRGLGGELRYNAVLNEDKVRRMRTLYADGYTYRELVELFQVSHGAVYGVVNRRNWKHVA